MKYKYIYSVFIILIIIGFSACSELQTDLPTNPGVTVHGEGNTNPTSANFHGLKVENSTADKKLRECQQCHGADYSGGVADKSCSTCHSGITVHTGDYKLSDHFSYFYVNSKTVKDCWGCHKGDYSGTNTSPTCLTCHAGLEVHKETDAPHHNVYLAGAKWDFNQCTTCHGLDFAGKTDRTAASCLTCHTNTGGPQACNTCHGDFNDPTKIAPPRGLLNKADRNEFAGAHTNHLYSATLSTNLECGECHVVPASVDAATHIDDGLRAEVNFGQIRAVAAAGDPVYNQSTLTCDNTYCHGNFEFGSIKGNNFSPSWTGTDQAKCGTCHGDATTGNPLPTGHFPIGGATCSQCHANVVDADNNIKDKTLHINGAKDF